MVLKQDLVRATLVGAAVGDAFGVPFEFLDEETVRTYDLDRMRGADDADPVPSRWGMRYSAGSWSDDTSMAVATMESMIAHAGKFDGNGSLMRIFPLSLAHAAAEPDIGTRISEVCCASEITHAHPISMFSCVFFNEFMFRVLAGESVADAYGYARSLPYESLLPSSISANWHLGLSAHKRLLSSDFSQITQNQLTASGYVVDTLEIVMYSLLCTKSFDDAIRECVRFGFDTDTYACIAGLAAGATYGYDAIPVDWLEKLKRSDYLDDVAHRFWEALSANDGD